MTAIGYLDTVARDAIGGWAWDPEQPDRRLEVFAWVDGAFHGRALANLVRPDLAQRGKGDGRYGFSIKGTPPVQAGRVRVAFADGTDLVGSPRTIVRPSPPIRTDPSNDVTILAIAKDEAPYIEQWIAYHRAVGVRHFLIYDNDSRDGTGRLLRNNPTLDGFVEVIDWPASAYPSTSGPQLPAYAHAVSAVKQRGGWIAVLDIDEYLVPLIDDDLPSLLARFADVSALSICWKVFGSSGHAHADDRLLIERFRFAGADTHVKSIVRAEMIEAIGTHAPVVSLGEPVDELRRPLEHRAFSRTPTHRWAQVNHYFAKSWEEWEAKRDRGRAGPAANAADWRRPDEHFHGMDAAREYDLSIQRFAPRLHAAMKELFGTVPLRETRVPRPAVAVPAWSTETAAARPTPIRLAFDPMPLAAGVAHGNIDGPAAVSRTIRIAPGSTTRFAGWVFDPARDETGRRFLLFQSADRARAADHAVELPERRPRPDVAAHYRQLPPQRTLDCGFDVAVDLRPLPRGRYGIGLGVVGADGIASTGQRWLLDLE